MATEPKATPRRHAADEVFDEMAAAVLRREIEPGDPLPPERELAERFEVSPLIVRQAIHRLADLGLARVRQGGATLACDPDTASDIRVIGLLYGAGARIAPTKRDDLDVLTKQVLQGMCLVQLAEMRGDGDALGGLARDLDHVSSEVAKRDYGDEESEQAFARFEEHFWRTVAASTKSRIFRLEVSFWYDVLVRRPEPPKSPLIARIAFYRELSQRLAARNGAASFYFAWMQPLLEALTKEAGTKAAAHKSAATKRKKR